MEESKILLIDKVQVTEAAIGFFEKASGIYIDKGKGEARACHEVENQREKALKEKAEKVLEQIKYQIEPRVICSHHTDYSIRCQSLKICGEEIRSAFWEKIPWTQVKGVFVYGITVGHITGDEKTDRRNDNKDLLDQFILDLWATAFVHGCKVEMQRYLNSTTKLAGSFGPGFFDMDTKEIVKLANIVNLEAIGMKLNKYYCLYPSKSILGLFLEVTDEFNYKLEPCKYCRGTHENCNFCHVARINTKQKV